MNAVAAIRPLTNLNASELRYRRLFEAAHDGILIVDPQTRRIIDVNPFLVKLTGYAYADFIDRELFEIGLLKDEAASQAAFRELQATGRIRYDDLPLLTKDGRSVAVEFVSNLYQEGNHQVIQCNIRDISGRKESEEEGRWKTALLEAQVNASLDGILVVDQDGKKILQNRRMADLFGIPRHIAEDPDDGKQLRWVTDRMKIPEQFSAKVQYLNSHPDEISRDVIELKDGTALDRYSSPVVGEAGKLYGRIWTFRDITERLRTERELKRAKIAAVVREGTKRYHFLADTVPLIIWTARPDGSVDYFNKAWFDYTGLPTGQPTGWDRAVHPDDLPACLGRWTHSFTTGEDYEIEYRFKRAADGTYRWFLGRATAQRDETGAIVQWVGTCTDIDDQKQAHGLLESRVAARTRELSLSNAALREEIAERHLAESALRESNEKFHQLADNITDVFWIRSPDLSEVQYVSPAFERIWGRSTGTLYANPHQWADYILPEDRARVEGAFAALTGGAPNLDIEYRIVRPDGAIRWVHTRGFQIRDAANRLIRHAGIVTDITERTNANEALRASENRYKAVFEQAAVGVAQVDAATGRFVHVNQRFSDIAGHSRQELEQLTFAAISHPAELTGNLEVFERLKAGRMRESTMEQRYLRQDGSTVWISLTVSAMWAPGEPPDYCIIIAQDITGRRRLDEHFLQAQKMEALGQFSGGVAHDFNNILAAINGYTELSLMVLQENPEVHAYLDAVLVAAARAADLVRQILTFSRQEPQERQVIDLLPVVAESLKLMRATIPSTIVFETLVATDTPTVLANANQVHQVLMNLGINACHAMKDRPGRLQVKLERCVVDATYAAAQPRLQPGVYARVSVSDTGAGMGQATLQRIFEPFYTTKPPGEGTGLGLAVVHGIMDSHDGAVTVYSQPGEGTMFRLYFPAHAGEVVVSAPAVETLARGHGERILVVDDEEMIALLLQKVMTTLGYAVEYVTQAESALARVRADPPHFSLVITDQTMPGMTGTVLAGQLLLIRPDLPIILMTGYSAALTSERVKAMGIRQLLPKPATIQELGAAAHAALAHPNPP